MKKNLVLVVCLVALTAAGSAFALDLPDALKIDGLSVSGDIKSGFRVEGATRDKGSENADVDSGAENPKAFAYSDDIGDGTPFRAQLVLQYEKENIGIKTRFRYKPDTGSGSGPANSAAGNFGNPFATAAGTINKAFIWGTALDKTVKVTAGKGLDGSWALLYSDFGPGATDSYDGKDGVRVEYTGIKGLNVGAFYGAGDLFKNATSNYDGDSDYTDRRLVVGAKYDNSRLAAVVSIYHNFVDLPGPGPARNYEYWNGGDVDPIGESVDNALPNTTNVLLGFQLKPTDSLPLTVDLSAALTNLGSMNYKKNNDLDQQDTIPSDTYYKDGAYNPYWGFQPKIKAAYDINDKLSVALALTDLRFADWYYYEKADVETTPGRNIGGTGNMFPATINLEPAYALTDDLTVAAELSFKINAGGSDQFGFGIKPSAEFSLGDGATFVVYDELVFWGQSEGTKDDNKDFIKEHPGIQNVLQNNGTAGTTNALQFDFVWSF